MATGDLIKLGTLYLNGVKKDRPTNPISGGNSHLFGAGQTIEIRNTDAADANKMQWREVNEGGKKYLVGDRVPIHSVSWNDLNSQSLITGKAIKIDGQDYKLRSLTGGSNYRNTSDAYAGGSPTNNEWDRWIVNEAGLPGLPTPTATELTNNSGNKTAAHNLIWNWFNMYSWAQETYTGNGTARAIRGVSAARYWNYNGSTSRATSYGFRPVLEVLNSAPVISLSTTNARTLYENDTYGISGNAKDTDSGNVVSVKYQINGGTTRAISTAISTGANIPFNKQLSFKGGMLYDGASAVTPTLAEGSQHVLKVWAEDDKGGKSVEQTRTFYVVPNRPASLTIDPFSQRTDLIDTDAVTVSGSVNDPDENNVKVKYKVANGGYTEVYDGAGGTFDFQVSLDKLADGKNTLTIQAVDEYGAVTSKTLEITKTENVQPLKQAVTRYKLTPPNGTAKGVLLWIEREVGDLTVEAEISMTNSGEPEDFKPMVKSSTAFVTEGIEEDEFTFEADTTKEAIILKITMERTSTASNKGITLISGVLN